MGPFAARRANALRAIRRLVESALKAWTKDIVVDNCLRTSSGCGTIARLVEIAFRGKIK